MTTPSRAQLVAAMAQHGYPIFHGGPYDLTLIGLRATPGKLDAFDDILIALYSDGKADHLEAWHCTLDPGKPSIDNPKRMDGTAVIDAIHHNHAYRPGTHHPGTPGAYPCLVPTGPIRVTRYASAGDYAAGKGTPSTSTTTQIHHAGRASTIVGGWSEGCVVLANEPDFWRLMDLVKTQAQHGLGDVVSLSVMGWPS